MNPLRRPLLRGRPSQRRHFRRPELEALEDRFLPASGLTASALRDISGFMTHTSPPPVNHSPVLNPVADQSILENSTLQLNLVASDQDVGAHLTFSLVGPVHNIVHLDAATGAFSFTPDLAPENVKFTVRVTDDGAPALFAETSFRVSVFEDHPVITAGSDAMIDKGSLLSRKGSFTNPAHENFHATVNYGDGSGTQNLPFDSTNSFQLNHAYLKEGNFTVTVKVSDGTDDFSSASFNVVVLPSASKVKEIKIADLKPGETSTISLTDPATGQGGDLMVTRSSTAAANGKALFALYGSNPTSVPSSAQAFLDIQITNPSPDDLVVLKYDPNLGNGTYKVGFIDPITGKWTPAPADVTYDKATGELTIKFKSTAIFGGTVFSISLSSAVTVPTTVSPPVVLANTNSNASDVPLDLRTALTFTSRTELTLSVTSSHDSQLAPAGSSVGTGSQGSSQAQGPAPVPGGLDFEGSSNLDLSQYFGDEGVLWWGVEMSKKSAGSSDKKKAAPAQSKGAPKPDKAQEPDDRQGDSSPSKTSEPPKKDEGKESGTEEQAILLVPADDEEGIDGIHTPAWILALPFVGLTHAAPANRDREKRSKRLAARTL